MTDEQFKILEDRLTAIEKQLKRKNYLLSRTVAFLDILSRLLVPSKFITDRLGFSKNTLANNKNLGRFQPLGKRRNYLEVGEAVFVEMNRSKSRLKEYFESSLVDE